MRFFIPFTINFNLREKKFFTEIIKCIDTPPIREAFVFVVVVLTFLKNCFFENPKELINFY